MKTLLFNSLFFALFASSEICAQDLIHYWNFNNETSNADMLIVNETIGGASINHLQVAGISAIVIGAGGNFDIENLNAQNGDLAGSHLRFNDPIGGGLEFVLPTTGYEDVVVQFTTRRSGSGAGDQLWYYSTDGGANYTLFTTVQSIDGNPVLTTLDFSVIVAANNNADFRVKVEFAQGGGGLVGNNRFDNFTVNALTFGTGGPSEPSIAVEPTALSAFAQTLGFPSSPQELTLSGANLTGDISIVVTGNFEISFNASDNYSASLELPTPLGFIVGTPVFVRLNTNTVGTSTGTLTFSTVDADNITFPLEGSTTAPQSSLLYYWHFNTLVTPTDVTVIDADYTLIAGFTGSFEYTDPVEGQRDIDAYSPGTLLNIQMGETPGSAARVRNPATLRSLVFDVPTTGAENIVFTYAVQRSENGSQSNTVEYSLDGTTFILAGLSNNTQDLTDFEVWQNFVYDFSGIEGANDNDNFKIRITFNHASAGNPSGNNRFDNITLTGTLLQSDLGLFESGETSVQVFPNPAIEAIAVIADQQIQQLYVFDAVGALVIQIEHINGTELSFDVSSLEAGIYMILVQTTTGYSQTRFVKN